MTKRNADGAPYTRPRSIEREITDALALAPKVVVTRAAVGDESSPEYLSCECLVHLMRDAVRRKDDDLRDRLLTILFQRCEQKLQAAIPDGRKANAAHLRDEVLGRFGELIAEDCSGESDGLLDYYECRFNHAFQTLRLTLLRSERNATKRKVELPAENGDDALQPDDERMAWLSDAFATPPDQEAALASQEARRDLCGALDALPPDDRAAVVLHFLLGFDIESVDANRATVATICGVTGRTIRTRLARALAALDAVLRRSHG
ncbi:MAG TPA: sigma factor-like helix-turn-helix DNA-binding protein [Actinotalea sp.]|nr:sigma factor-like helix-turn-helix DNA-binding protein [Actinotalea sp.]